MNVATIADLKAVERLISALPDDKRAEMALSQYDDWKRWRDFLALFHPK